VTTNVEYNKIHALARARKVVMQKYGPDLLHYWPMADDTGLVRDLLRQKALVGNGVAAQAPGMLDFAMDMQSGYIAVRRGCDVDQPRNLAKTVTVE